MRRPSERRCGEDGAQRLSGMAGGAHGHLLGGAGVDDLAALVAGFGAEVDDPIRGFDHIEVVFDDQDGMTGIDEALKHFQQDTDIVEMKPGGGFVKEKKRWKAGSGGFGCRGGSGRRIGEMSHEFQALALAAGQGVDGLAQLKVAEAHFFEQFQAGDRSLGRTGCGERTQELDGLLNGRVEEVGDGERTGKNAARTGGFLRFDLARGSAALGRIQPEFDVENVGAVPATVAVGAADENVAEELHFDSFEAGAAAALALALGGVKAEGAGVEAALFGEFRLGEEFADVIKGADIDSGIRARGFGQDRLVHQQRARKERGGWRSESCGGGGGVGSLVTAVLGIAAVGRLGFLRGRVGVAAVRAGKRISRTSVVLPEPLTPVTQTKRPSGISTVRSLRLWRVA